MARACASTPARRAAGTLPAAALPRHLLAPLDPARFAPSAARPVRAKARRLDPDTEIRPHQHAWAQVAIAVSGVAHLSAETATYLVPAWRALWVPPGIEHVLRVVETTELRTLYIHQSPGEAGPGVAAAEQAAWRHCRVLEVSPLLRELVLQMGVHPDDNSAPDTEALAREHRLGALVLDELRRAATVPLGITMPHDKRLRALCQAVIADPTRHDSLAGWAAQAGASERTIARLFRDELATSFGPWRQQVLLGRALTLAAQGRPMGVIAAELGYASASAFSAMVRRSVGLPPTRLLASPVASHSPTANRAR
jgi:AraC-like DNA-binding protein